MSAPAAVPGVVTISLRVTRQRLSDLLCSAVEGGSNYWADFTKVERDPSSFDVLKVRLRDRTTTKPSRVVTVDDLARGIEALGEATFPAAARHLADALDVEGGDATTADVVLQMTVFGDVVYG